MEDHYRKDMSLEEGVELAVRGISMAMKRDSASGDGINLATIDKKHGFRRYSPEEVEKIRKKFQ